MKLIKILSALVLAILCVGCEDESWAEIDSLSVDGNEFFCNQKVKLWMNVKSDNLPEVDYEWGCEGGRLTQPQGLDEMTWQAPGEPGTYRVFCKVTIDGKSETRHHDMYVSSFFFEKFEKSTHSFKAQGSTTLAKRTETINGTSNGYLEAVVNSTSASNRYIYYNFANPELKIPFSCMAKIGWLSDFPVTDIKVGTSTFANKFYYQVTMNRDPDKEDAAYIDDVRFEWYPVGNTNGLPIDEESGLPWNGRFQFKQNLNGSATWFNVYVDSPELNFAQGVRKNVSFSIDANYLVHVYLNGVKILETDAIKNWRIANNSKDDMYVNEWRLIFPNGNGGNKPPKIFFDDAYALIDGTILTGN